MWIDELLQGQERNELAMLCKFVFIIVCNVTLNIFSFLFFIQTDIHLKLKRKRRLLTAKMRAIYAKCLTQAEHVPFQANAKVETARRYASVTSKMKHATPTRTVSRVSTATILLYGH